MIAQHFVELIAGEVNVKPEQVAAAISFFDKGATIPFVARYRKDATGGLSESKLERIEERNDYFVALCSRRDAMLDNIEKQGRLTEELRASFEACSDHVILEDLSLSYKKQRNNRAAIAANKGLLSLADYIWAQSATSPPPILYAESFVGPDKQVLSVEEALEGARHILAECFAVNAAIRRQVRESLFQQGKLTVNLTRVEAEKSSRFNALNGFQKPLKEIADDVLLTIFKGEREGALRLELVLDDEGLIDTLTEEIIQDRESACALEMRAAMTDAYKRLLRPVIEEEVLTRAKRKAEDAVMAFCREHLRNLLLSAPAGRIPAMGLCCWSPQLRSFAVLDGNGAVLSTASIQGETPEDLDAKTEETLVSLLKANTIEGIGISGGPGGREALRVAQACLRKTGSHVFATLVHDSGLAAYVHSGLSGHELPGMEDAAKAAVSIARRFQDPLRELVKVEPCSLIPSRLAHGVNRKRLQAGAVRTIEAVVNRVGADVNSDTVEILRYVSGFQLGVAQSVVEKRTQLEGFKNRAGLLEVSGIGEKTHQQSIGFLRIHDGDNPLDASAIHPEAYPVVAKMLEQLGRSLEEVRNNPEVLHELDLKSFADENTGVLALEDICYEFGRIGRDPRRRYRPPQQMLPLTALEDLEEGMVLEGIITNIMDFGVFVSLGLPQEGLVHRSEIGRSLLSDPKRSLQVGDVVKVLVLKVEKDVPKIALSIKGAVKLPLSRPKRLRNAEPRNEISDRSERDGQAARRRRPDGERDMRGPRDSGFEQRRPPRRQGKDAISIPRINKSDSKKEEGGLLNTTLADQLAALRDKIVSGKK